MGKVSCRNCSTAVETKPTKNGNPRLPTGWKTLRNEIFCSNCWKEKFVLRAICMPVSGPIDLSWDTFAGHLEKCWAQSTGLANWAVTEMAKADAIRMPQDPNLKNMPYIYLYPKARELFPELAAKSVVALLHSVEQRYRRRRLQVLWRNEESLQRYKYPVAYPVNSQGWSPTFSAGKRAQVTFNLCGESVTLRLGGGAGLARQLLAFSKLVSGQAVACDLAIYRQRASNGDHRRVVNEKAPGGGSKTPFRVMVRMTGWFPRSESNKTRTGTLKVQTGSAFFLTATSEKREPWILNADHVRRWIARHRKVLDRFSEDRKHEKRWPKRSRRQMTDYMARQVDLQKRRLDTFCKQTCAMVAGLASRLQVEEVQWDDSIRSFTLEFPWYKLKHVLERKLSESGIRFIQMPHTSEEEKVAA